MLYNVPELNVSSKFQIYKEYLKDKLFFPGVNKNDAVAIEARPRLLYLLMLAVNFTAIVFLSVIIYFTTEKICNDYEARTFLESAKYLPTIPSKVLTYSIGIFSLFVINAVIKWILYKRNLSWAVTISLVADLVMCGFITYQLNFSYKGLVFLVIAGIFLYVQQPKIKAALLVVTLMVFIVMDYDLLTVYINLASIQDYLNYYNEKVRLYLYGIKNVIESINQINFIVFFSVLIHSKISENKEYIRLNNMLNEKVEELKIANEKLELYSKESVKMAKMKERNRLAREIHDILGHSLTNITVGIEACIDLLDYDTETAKEQMRKIKEISRRGLLDVRRSVRQLKADSIEKYELVPAIYQLIDEIKSFSDTKIDLVIEGQILKLQDDEEQTIYRVIQESITNSLRHGNADMIKITMSFQYHELKLVIEDNGIGTSEVHKDFGLTHMEERVNMLGGKISFHSELNKGFRTEVILPVRWGSAYD